MATGGKVGKWEMTRIADSDRRGGGGAQWKVPCQTRTRCYPSRPSESHTHPLLSESTIRVTSHFPTFPLFSHHLFVPLAARCWLSLSPLEAIYAACLLDSHLSSPGQTSCLMPIWRHLCRILSESLPSPWSVPCAVERNETFRRKCGGLVPLRCCSPI